MRFTHTQKTKRKKNEDKLDLGVCGLPDPIRCTEARDHDSEDPISIAAVDTDRDSFRELRFAHHESPEPSHPVPIVVAASGTSTRSRNAADRQTRALR